MNKISTFLVSVEKLVISPHLNADALELAAVGGFLAVVKKGEFKTGDYALYIPEQSIVPMNIQVEMGIVGMLAGSKHDRVKAKRLRGVLSQGLVYVPRGVSQSELKASLHTNRNWALELGIVKWTPEIPRHLLGEVKASPIVKYFDVENIKRFPNIFVPGESVVATEKVHGVQTVLTFEKASRDLFVSSKSYSKDGKALVESASNVYWRMAKQFKAREALEALCLLFDADVFTLHGETYGQGVQDLGYAAKSSLGFVAFDAHYEREGKTSFLSFLELQESLKGLLPVVPVLYEGPYDYQLLVDLAEGMETVSGTSAHLREGLVVRSKDSEDVRYAARKLAKFISAAYLLRANGTELE